MLLFRSRRCCRVTCRHSFTCLCSSTENERVYVDILLLNINQIKETKMVGAFPQWLGHESSFAVTDKYWPASGNWLLLYFQKVRITHRCCVFWYLAWLCSRERSDWSHHLPGKLWNTQHVRTQSEKTEEGGIQGSGWREGGHTGRENTSLKWQDWRWQGEMCFFKAPLNCIQIQQSEDLLDWGSRPPSGGLKHLEPEDRNHFLV